MSILEEMIQPAPNTLDAFVYQREGLFLFKVLGQDIRESSSDPSSLVSVSLVEFSYQGRTLTRELEEPYVEKQKVSGGSGEWSQIESGPNVYIFLVDLLRCIREVEALTTSREQWEDVFGPSIEEGGADEAYEQRMPTIHDAKILFGTDYAEFASVSDYDDNFLWLAWMAALVVPQQKTGEVSEMVVERWLKGEGDLCDEGSPVALIKLGEETIEVVASTRGTLHRIVVTEGETVLAGKIMAYIKLDED